jgi:hypothetical protein
VSAVAASPVAKPSLKLTPNPVKAGHALTVNGSADGCPVGDTVFVISHAFPTRHTFAGLPAVPNEGACGRSFPDLDHDPAQEARGCVHSDGALWWRQPWRTRPPARRAPVAGRRDLRSRLVGCDLCGGLVGRIWSLLGDVRRCDLRRQMPAVHDCLSVASRFGDGAWLGSNPSPTRKRPRQTGQTPVSLPFRSKSKPSSGRPPVAAQLLSGTLTPAGASPAGAASRGGGMGACRAWASTIP